VTARVAARARNAGSARRPRSTVFWAILVTGVAQFMAALDNLVVTTALPVIRRSLGTGLAGLEWTVNAFTLSFAVLLLTGRRAR
jgi:MFS family permease